MKLPHSLPFLPLSSLSFILMASNPVHANPPQTSFHAVSPSQWNLAWQGVAGHIYFVQHSSDLRNWSFNTQMEFGTGSKSLILDSNGAPGFFARLVSVPNAGINSLSEAEETDFDNDGISNLQELAVYFTNPLDFNDPGGEDDLPTAFEMMIGSSPVKTYEVDSPDTSLQLFLPSR